MEPLSPSPHEASVESSFYGDRDAEAARVAYTSLSALAARVHGVKPFPLSAHRVIAATANPTTTPQELASILEMDPGLAARVLRLVNSAAYGIAEPCKTVAHAAALLGPARVAEVATAAVVLALFGEDSAQVQRVLEHSVGVAAVARRLALRFDLRADDVFTCALLHDIGKLMMLEEPGYEELLAREHDRPDDIVAEERERYGFDHAVLAGMLLTKWKLPRPIPEVVSWHHSPALAYDAPPAIATTVHLLRLADALSFMMRTPEPDAAVVEALAQEEPATALDLGAEDLARSWQELYKALERSRGATDPTREPDATEREPAPADPATLGQEVACDLCGVNTFGQTCPRCQKPLCAAHAPARNRCCAACEAEYERAVSRETRRTRFISKGAGIFSAAAIGSVVLHRAVDVGASGPWLWGGVLGFAAAASLAIAALVLRWRARAGFFAGG